MKIDLGSWANDLFNLGKDWLSSKISVNTPSTPAPVISPVTISDNNNKVLEYGLIAAVAIAGVALFIKK